jgi:hypothetical protein
MEKTTRRTFCGTAFLAIPAMTLVAKGVDIGGERSFDNSDAIFNSLADEFARITADGAQNGFKAEHFRRYAGFIRMVDVQMEYKGVNREANKRLDDDDFHKLNPIKSAKFISEYWRKRNLDLSEDEIAAKWIMEGRSYREGKMAIKRIGGIRTLNAVVAKYFEIKAKEYETAVLRGGPFMRQGRIVFPPQDERPALLNAQYSEPDVPIPEDMAQLMEMLNENPLGEDFMTNYTDQILGDPAMHSVDALELLGVFTNKRRDCLCRAMVVQSSILALICLFGCAPCCLASASMAAMEKLMEGLRVCNPNNC